MNDDEDIRVLREQNVGVASVTAREGWPRSVELLLARVYRHPPSRPERAAKCIAINPDRVSL